MASILALLSQPLAITEEGLKLITAIATRDEVFAEARIAAATAHAGELTNDRPDLDIQGGVATIAVQGPLVRHADMFSAISGASSYEQIGAELEAALCDERVGAIILDVDSPGGEVTGCGELARCIRAAAEQKPVIALASGGMCSAAYWLASAAQEIVADPSALIGSIGVRCLLVDDSKAKEQAGFKSYEIVSSQSPYKVVDAAVAEDRNRVRASLDAMASVFIADVAVGRGITAGKVASDFGKGAVFVGQAAVDAGLADRLGNLQSLVAELATKPAVQFAAKRTGANPMARKMNPAATGELPATTAAAGEKCKGCDGSFGASSDMYCSKCMDGDDDEEDEEAKGFVTSVLAMTGQADKSSALGFVAGLKAKADLADALGFELTALKKASATSEIKSLIDAACADGRVAPAKRAEVEKMAADHGLVVLRSALGFMQKSPTATVEMPAKSLSLVPATAAVGDRPAVALSDDGAKVAKALGIDPAKYAAHHTDYKRGFQAVEEK